MAKNFIAGAIKHPGALRASAGVAKGHKIPIAQLHQLAKEPGKTGQRARFALILHNLHHNPNGAK